MSVYKPGRTVRTAAAQKRNVVLIFLGYLAVYYVVLTHMHGDMRTLVMFFGIGAPLVYSAIVKDAIKRYNQFAAPAIEALRRNLPAQAERDLLALRPRARWVRNLRNVNAYNLGLAYYKQGQYAQALAELEAADRGGGAPNIDPTLASTTALIHALAGKLELAELWLTEAKHRYLGRVVDAPFPSIMTEVVLGLRRGQYAEVRRRFDLDWPVIESSRKGETLRPLRLLRAFAITQDSNIRDAAASAPFVAALHPTRATEFAYLAVAWPEMHDFLQTALPA